jgi:hypothetical protein
VEQEIRSTIDRKLSKSERAEETRRADMIYRKLDKPECRANTREITLSGILNKPENITLTDND